MTVPNAWPDNLGSAADWGSVTAGQADAGSAGTGNRLGLSHGVARVHRKPQAAVRQSDAHQFGQARLPGNAV